MYFDLTDEQQAIKQTAHDFLASRFKSERLREIEASESGFDVRSGLRNDAILQAYEKDPQLQLMLDNAAQLRAKGMEPSTPGLGEASQSGSQNGR